MTSTSKEMAIIPNMVGMTVGTSYSKTHKEIQNGFSPKEDKVTVYLINRFHPIVWS